MPDRHVVSDDLLEQYQMDLARKLLEYQTLMDDVLKLAVGQQANWNDRAYNDHWDALNDLVDATRKNFETDFQSIVTFVGKYVAVGRDSSNLRL